MSAKGIQGLYQGKIIKTGKKSCFSEKKSIKRWYPNVSIQ